MDDDLGMAAADFERIHAALVARKIRVTIDALPVPVATHDRELTRTQASDRLARHELGVRGVWVHDLRDTNSTHSIEMLGADPDQQRLLLTAGAVWVGPRHMQPA